MPDNYNVLTSIESLATHSNCCSRMPEPNNYVRHQSVDHIGTLIRKTVKMRTISATMANPAISYNADRTHLNSMSLHAVTSLISFPSLMTSVMFHANKPKENSSDNVVSKH